MNHKLDGDVVLRYAPAGQACGNCRHSMPAAVYPKEWCFVANAYKEKTEYCCRYQVRDDA